MRNDFYGRLNDSAPALLRWMDQEQGLLERSPRLSKGELDRRSSGMPAEKVGLDFEEDLVETAILDDADGDARRR